MCQTLAHVLDCVRVLVQSENISASFQERFGVAAAAAGSVEDEQSCFRIEQFNHFSLQHRTMIEKILRWLCALFRWHRINGEPGGRRVPEWANGVLSQHTVYKTISFATCWVV